MDISRAIAHFWARLSDGTAKNVSRKQWDAVVKDRIARVCIRIRGSVSKRTPLVRSYACPTPAIQFDGTMTRHVGCSGCCLGGREDGHKVYCSTARRKRCARASDIEAVASDAVQRTEEFVLQALQADSTIAFRFWSCRALDAVGCVLWVEVRAVSAHLQRMTGALYRVDIKRCEHFPAQLMAVAVPDAG